MPTDKIANTMKLAIVSIEDKRFAEHNGVDWKGTLTGLAGYASGDVDTRGGSTIEQQYIKNYQLLVTAKTDAEKRAAVETTPARKLREIRMALTLDKTFTKPEILTRYLNLVSFGNGSFGVQDAAQTYFGINASDLNWQQAALLAGMVQSTSTLNPYTNPDGALARRNLVLDTMIDNLPQETDALRAAKATPLGILPQPNELPRGCIAAGDRAFFCDYVQEYLSRAGISKEQVARGGYLIRTTLDPDVQIPVKTAIDRFASPSLPGISSVMSVIQPGKTSHKVMAMASNRTYGLNIDAGQTMRPQPFSLVGDGAGSVFKIFTTAAALDMGMGINATLDAPPRFQSKGLGSGGAKGCPKDTWCVVNAGNYRGSMNVTDALATSPNTAFAKLISQVGVTRTVDMAVKLGLRSYADPGTARDYNPDSNESLADFVKRQNIGSFTLGPIEVNALELSNVAATLASGGVWCPPNPIDKLFDRNGNEVAVTTETCDQVVPEGLANTLANAMSKDATGSGTAAGSAGAAGWDLPVSGKTGTTEAHRSSGFVGFTSHYAAANYIYDDSTTPTDLCSSPLRHCGEGDLYGGNEPARTWFTAMKPIALSFGTSIAAHRSPLRRGGARLTGAQRRRHGVDAARPRLKDAGFQVADQTNSVNSSATLGEVVGTSPTGKRFPARSSPFRSATASRRRRRRRRMARRCRSVRRWWRSPGCRRSPFRCWRLRPAARAAASVGRCLEPPPSTLWRELRCPRDRHYAACMADVLPALIRTAAAASVRPSPARLRRGRRAQRLRPARDNHARLDTGFHAAAGAAYQRSPHAAQPAPQAGLAARAGRLGARPGGQHRRQPGPPQSGARGGPGPRRPAVAAGCLRLRQQRLLRAAPEEPVELPDQPGAPGAGRAAALAGSAGGVHRAWLARPHPHPPRVRGGRAAHRRRGRRRPAHRPRPLRHDRGPGQPRGEPEAGIDPFARAARAGPLRRRRLPAGDGRTHARRAALPAVLRRAGDQLRPGPDPGQGTVTLGRQHAVACLGGDRHLPVCAGAVLLPARGHPADVDRRPDGWARLSSNRGRSQPAASLR